MSKHRTVFFLLLSILIAGCSLMGTNRVGDAPEEVRVNAIKPKKHSKEDVARLLGSPTSITLFEKESWLYIESVEQKRLFLLPKEIERNVIQVTFNKDNLVESVHKYKMEDGKKIAYDKDATPVEGKDLSVVDELVGNFGRFASSNKGGQ